MRVGIFLLLSLVLHLATGFWQAAPLPASVASAGAAEAIRLPVLMQMKKSPATPLAPVTPVAEPVVTAPLKAVPASSKARPAVATANKLSRPPSEPVIVDKTVVNSAADESHRLPQAPGASALDAKQALPEPATEVVSQAPRFREPPDAPVYPVQARRRNQQGQVLLEVRLDARGNQRGVQLLRSSGFSSLDQAAAAAVADWKFQPEVQDGRALPSRVQIPIDFALNSRR